MTTLAHEVETGRHLDGSSTAQLAGLYGYTFAKRDNAADQRDTAVRGTLAWEINAAAVHVFNGDLRDLVARLAERGVRTCEFCPCLGGDHFVDCPEVIEMAADYVPSQSDLADAGHTTAA